jgi:phage portal protein BeeE
LADAVSSLPLHVYRKTELRRERVTSGRLVDLLERPSPGVSEADLTSTLMTHLAVWGNGYIGKFREQGEVTQLDPLHPTESSRSSRTAGCATATPPAPALSGC